jgi:hypothetical protein
MMDLNDLYFRHQISLMRASEASGAALRAGHRAKADDLAREIGRWQRLIGAAAASQWDGSHVANASLPGRQMSSLDCLCA